MNAAAIMKLVADCRRRANEPDASYYARITYTDWADRYEHLAGLEFSDNQWGLHETCLKACMKNLKTIEDRDRGISTYDSDEPEVQGEYLIPNGEGQVEWFVA